MEKRSAAARAGRAVWNTVRVSISKWDRMNGNIESTVPSPDLQWVHPKTPSRSLKPQTVLNPVGKPSLLPVWSVQNGHQMASEQIVPILWTLGAKGRVMFWTEWSEKDRRFYHVTQNDIQFFHSVFLDISWPGVIETIKSKIMKMEVPLKLRVRKWTPRTVLLKKKS